MQVKEATNHLSWNSDVNNRLWNKDLCIRNGFLTNFIPVTSSKCDLHLIFISTSTTHMYAQLFVGWLNSLKTNSLGIPAHKKWTSIHVIAHGWMTWWGSQSLLQNQNI